MNNHATKKVYERDVFVVGISGTTCSGKTTVCDRLRKSFHGCHSINMDDYFLLDDSPKHIRLPEFNGHANWEILESVDMERLRRDVAKWRLNEEDRDSTISVSLPGKKILFVEGILIFNDQELVKLFDKMYHLTVPKEVCWERRRLRRYEPPDPPGYFDAIVWPEYLMHLERLKRGATDNIVYLDCSQSTGEAFDRIYNDLANI